MIRFIFFEKRENLPILWNLVKLSKMKFHETSEIIFNFENLWNFLSHMWDNPYIHGFPR